MQPGNHPPDPGHDPAAAKFWTLQAVRLVGILIAMAGAAGVAEKLPLPQWFAGLLLAAGVGIFFGVPIALAKKWKAEQ